MGPLQEGPQSSFQTAVGTRLPSSPSHITAGSSTRQEGREGGVYYTEHTQMGGVVSCWDTDTFPPAPASAGPWRGRVAMRNGYQGLHHLSSFLVQ